MTNPYQPSLAPQEHALVHVRFVWPATILVAIAIAAASIELPPTVGNYLRNGTMQNAVGALMTMLFLSLAIICSLLEWLGSIRSQQFVTWALLPIVLLTVLIVYNLFTNVIDGLTLQQVIDNPSPVLDG